MNEQGAGPAVKRPEANPLRRLVVAEHVYHCDGADSDTVSGSPWSLALKNDDRPYQRRHRLAEKDGWSAPLDLGWVKDPSMLLIENRGKGNLELALPDGTRLSILPPGTSTRLMVKGLPLDGWRLVGMTTATVTAYPS